MDRTAILAMMGELKLYGMRTAYDEIMAGDHGARLLAGFMLRRCADRLRSQSTDGRATVFLHYDH